MLNVPDDFQINFFEKSSDPPIETNTELKFPSFDFATVKHVENVKSAVELRTLVYSLICKCTNLLERIASLFYWLANVEKFQFQCIRCTENSLDLQFNNLLTLISWQPSVFEFLCRCLGVPCTTITGIARTLDNSPLPESDHEQSNHTWNGIFFNDKWYLCDISWSSQVKIKSFKQNLSMNSKSTKNTSFTNLYFFMTPIQMRTTHFPLNYKWQLLPDYISYEKFDSYPILTAHFFYSPLMNLNYDEYRMVSEKGYFTLVLPFEGESSFFHLLQYLDKDSKQLITKTKSNIHIKSYSLIENMKDNVTLYFRFPWQGYYYITICSQNETDEGHLFTHYKALLKWKIVCNTTNESIERYFGCQDINLGPSWSHLRYFGLEPVNLASGIIKLDFSPPAYIEACFTKSKPEVVVIAKIKGSTALLPTNYISDSSIDTLNSLCYGECLDWLIDDEDDTGSEITFTIRLPKYGEYSLTIYANFPKEGDTFVNVAQYLLDLKQKKSDHIGGMN